MNKNNTLTYRVTQLEKNYLKLDTKIDLLMTNYLPSIERKLAQLDTKITIFTGLNVAAIIVGILISRIIG